MRAGEASLVPPARLELPLLDPQVARKIEIVAAKLLDETLRVLVSDEHLSSTPSGKSGERASSTIARTLVEFVVVDAVENLKLSASDLV